MKEKPLDHKKGTACDPSQTGPNAELCTPLVRGRVGERAQARECVSARVCVPRECASVARADAAAIAATDRVGRHDRARRRAGDDSD